MLRQAGEVLKAFVKEFGLLKGVKYALTGRAIASAGHRDLAFRRLPKLYQKAIDIHERIHQQDASSGTRSPSELRAYVVNMESLARGDGAQMAKSPFSALRFILFGGVLIYALTGRALSASSAKINNNRNSGKAAVAQTMARNLSCLGLKDRLNAYASDGKNGGRESAAKDLGLIRAPNPKQVRSGVTLYSFTPFMILGATAAAVIFAVNLAGKLIKITGEKNPSGSSLLLNAESRRTLRDVKKQYKEIKVRTEECLARESEGAKGIGLLSSEEWAENS